MINKYLNENVSQPTLNSLATKDAHISPGVVMGPRGEVKIPRGELNYSVFQYFLKTRKTTIYSALPGECQDASYDGSHTQG